MPYDFRSDPILYPAYEYWRSKCGARAMPRRRDLDPIEIPPRLLPYIQITELLGARVRYRLVGTAIVRSYGAELQGKYFDEVFPEERLRFVEDNYRRLAAEKRPLFVCNAYHSKRNAPLVCFRLVMPLSEDGAIVNQCLTAMRFQFRGEAHQWLSGALASADAAPAFAESVG